MATELELKLSLPPQFQQSFQEIPLLSAVPMELQPLFNAYFDTPDLQLQQAKVALRIRRKGNDFIQTLKTRGSAKGGLHDRQEWEWQVADEKLDISLIQPLLPEAINCQQLTTLFSTDFQRRCWNLERNGSRIELVLDQGQVHTDLPQDFARREDPISEVELELKQGEAAELFYLAAELATTIPLRISRISKAERGYRLMLGDQAPEHVTPVDCEQALGQLLARLEYADFSADTSSYQQVSKSLLMLEQQLPQSLPATVQQTLRATAAKVQASDSATDSQQALWHPGFCQALLQISTYLFLKRSDSTGAA